MKLQNDILACIGKFISITLREISIELISNIIDNYYSVFRPDFIYYRDFNRGFDLKSCKNNTHLMITKKIKTMFKTKNENGVRLSFTDGTNSSLPKNQLSIIIVQQEYYHNSSNIYIEVDNTVSWTTIFLFINSIIKTNHIDYISSGFASIKNDYTGILGGKKSYELLMNHPFITGQHIIKDTLRFDKRLSNYIDSPHIIQFFGNNLLKKLLLRELCLTIGQNHDLMLLKKLENTEHICTQYVNNGVLINIDLNIAYNLTETFNTLKKLNYAYTGYIAYFKEPVLYYKKSDLIQWHKWSKRFED